MSSETQLLEGVGEYKYGFSDPETFVFRSRKGLDQDVIRQISAKKGGREGWNSA
jgi:Fe-S cluster assembly protein SufB